MGYIADWMLEGGACYVCGEPLGEPTGYPVKCDACKEDGEDEDDDESHWSSLKKRSQRKRARNRAASRAKLAEEDIEFEVKYDGAHLIVEDGEGKIDFWPGTGKYIVRSTGKKGRGVFNLIKYVQGQEDAN